MQGLLAFGLMAVFMLIGFLAAWIFERRPRATKDPKGPSQN